MTNLITWPSHFHTKLSRDAVIKMLHHIDKMHTKIASLRYPISTNKTIGIYLIVITLENKIIESFCLIFEERKKLTSPYKRVNMFK